MKLSVYIKRLCIGNSERLGGSLGGGRVRWLHVSRGVSRTEQLGRGMDTQRVQWVVGGGIDSRRRHKKLSMRKSGAILVVIAGGHHGSLLHGRHSLC